MHTPPSRRNPPSTPFSRLCLGHPSSAAWFVVSRDHLAAGLARMAPHRAAPHRAAPHRTAPHRAALARDTARRRTNVRVPSPANDRDARVCRRENAPRSRFFYALSLNRRRPSAMPSATSRLSIVLACAALGVISRLMSPSRRNGRSLSFRDVVPPRGKADKCFFSFFALLFDYW